MNAGRPTGGKVELDHPSVLVADDDNLQRRAVRAALEAHGFIVVAEAADAASTIAGASRLEPDFCLIELELPGDALNAIARIAKASPRTLVVVLTASDRQEDVVAAYTRGAAGYILKEISDERLASTLRAAYRGEPAVSRSLVPYLVDEIRRGSARRVTLPEGAVTLTPREWDVGELLLEGNSTAEIAERLGVSPVTVRRHVGLLLRKLGAETREEAVKKLRYYRKR
jgi:DNA-binding NarL/FixJ family response regulator